MDVLRIKLLLAEIQNGERLIYTYTLLPLVSRYVFDGRYNIDNN